VALWYSLSAPTFTSQSIKRALKSPPLLNFPFLFISFILPYHMFQPTNSTKKVNNLGLPPEPLSLEELADKQEPPGLGAG
jgi:hypothetical protein